MIRNSIGILFGLFFLQIPTWAGKSVGNGGDAIVCPTGVQFLDEYEATLYGNTINFGPIGSDPFKMVEFALQRMSINMPLRMARYSQWLKDFQSEAVFKSGIELSDIDDSGLSVIPVNCKQVQAVIQLSDSDLPVVGYRYLVNEDLWIAMSAQSQAMLILHELIYREAILVGAQNSLRVRMMNRFIASSDSNLNRLFEIQELFGGIYSEDHRISLVNKINEDDSIKRNYFRYSIENTVVEYKFANRQSLDFMQLRTSLCQPFDLSVDTAPSNGSYVLPSETRSIQFDSDSEFPILSQKYTFSGPLLLLRDSTCTALDNSLITVDKPIIFPKDSSLPQHKKGKKLNPISFVTSAPTLVDFSLINSIESINWPVTSLHLPIGARTEIYMENPQSALMKIFSGLSGFDITFAGHVFTNVKSFSGSLFYTGNELQFYEENPFRIRGNDFSCKRVEIYPVVNSNLRSVEYRHFRECSVSFLTIPTTIGSVKLKLESEYGFTNSEFFTCGIALEPTQAQNINGEIVKISFNELVCINPAGYFFKK